MTGYQILPWLISVVAIIIAGHYARQVAKHQEIDMEKQEMLAEYVAGIYNLNQRLEIIANENNRLRFFLGLSYEPPVPSDKVIVLERRKKKVDNPLTPRIL